MQSPHRDRDREALPHATGSGRNSSGFFWHDYWNNYFPKTPLKDQDLLRQTANTVNKEPVSLDSIRQRVDRILSLLCLSPSDNLVDFCCGNGLFDFELAPYVNSIVAVDFAENMIDAAQRLKQRENIRYCNGNITAPLSTLIDGNQIPNKFLMLSSLGYLQLAELDVILYNILQHLEKRAFEFLIVGIPNADLNANFYNTPERMARHLENERTHPDTNDGVGRWWRAEEIEAICAGHGLSTQIVNQPVSLSNYRMDAIIRSISPVRSR